MEETNLKTVLQECSESAKNGYRIARDEQIQLNRILYDAQTKLQLLIEKINRSTIYMPETKEALLEQFAGLQQQCSQLSYRFTEELQDLKENLSEFSVTLFGRTMAGKSTLMEILTEGDGHTIGKGAQRTTRDVREYPWNGLKITDVPGIAAFEGQADEQIAWENARKADLILFLLTDDAPQFAEAEWFSKLVELGKPIICIVNVKSAISEEKSLKLALRDLNKRFDLERLETIRKQFLDFSAQFSQSWEQIPFVYTHLKSAYMALCADDEEKKKLLTEASRIDDFKRLIIQQVQTNGRFYRIKTFGDMILLPIIKSIEDLHRQAADSRTQSRIILDKTDKLSAWKLKFCEDSKRQILVKVASIRSDLVYKTAIFAEDHFDDENINEAWKREVNLESINYQCNTLLRDLNEKCTEMLLEISREIEKELEFMVSDGHAKSLKMERIVDIKDVFGKAALALEAGLMIAAVFRLIPHAEKIAIGVEIIRKAGKVVLPDIKKRERKAIEKLEGQLKKNIDKMCEDIHAKLNESFDMYVVSRISRVILQLSGQKEDFTNLAESQDDLAEELNHRIREVNLQYLNEVIRLIEPDGLQSGIQDVARIPGKGILIEFRDRFVIEKAFIDRLSELTGEKVDYVFWTDDKELLLARLLKKYVSSFSCRINEKTGVAEIRTGYKGKGFDDRKELAEQLMGMKIRVIEDIL